MNLGMSDLGTLPTYTTSFQDWRKNAFLRVFSFWTRLDERLGDLSRACSEAAGVEAPGGDAAWLVSGAMSF